jgi:hypothetical protein
MHILIVVMIDSWQFRLGELLLLVRQSICPKEGYQGKRHDDDDDARGSEERHHGGGSWTIRPRIRESRDIRFSPLKERITSR